ncbi:Katanin p60 ATPase-containing subunit A-like 1 [Eumeta japonica]|uniref:Katanin p60 ATPase-containing subunit A-like 1 n=1 Tax=Eumeta variegata TaxID=151549 RepID=A0A4C1T5X6_EUMVA|nr:Katanin p60 ATPase-containing subunit A-like 1 [Eumeta japonica]
MKDKLDMSNVVYRIPCGGNGAEECGEVYIGTTKNKLRTRLAGHKSDQKYRTTNLSHKTALTAHCVRLNHFPKFEDTTVLNRESNYRRRLTLEMLQIINTPVEKRINFKADIDNIAQGRLQGAKVSCYETITHLGITSNEHSDVGAREALDFQEVNCFARSTLRTLQLLRGGKQKTKSCVGMTVMSKTSIAEICENAKLARDMALTGDYDSASIYYEGLQGLLARMISSTNDPLRKGKWTMVKQQISKEYSQIKEIQRTLSEMTLDLQSSQFASKLRTHTSEAEARDPSSWFQPDPDIWTPPPKDPDVWGPPKPEKSRDLGVKRCLKVLVRKLSRSKFTDAPVVCAVTPSFCSYVYKEYDR